MISNAFPDLKILGGATMDDGKLMKNFQFFNKSIYENTITYLYMQSNNNFDLAGALELKASEIYFNVVKTSNQKTVLEKLDGIPAVDAFFRKINKTDYPLKSKDLLYRATMSYPIVTDDGKSSTGIGAIYGKGILLGHPVNGEKIFLLQSSGRHIPEITKQLEKSIKEKKMVLGSMCETSVDILGNKLYDQSEGYCLNK